MAKSTPYFSIVIPTYNRAHLIAQTIDSILNQEYEDFEILVVDDGSTDDTERVVKNFTDARIAYFKKENAERAAARNYGRARARGQYVNFFDSDDLMYPNHLTIALAVIKKENNPAFFHLGYDFKTPEGEVTKTVNTLNSQSFKDAIFDNFLSCNGVFVRTDVASKYPFEETRVLASAEDWELWIRLMCRYPFVYSNEITTSVVSHDARSIRTIAPDKIVKRDLFLIECLRKDAEVVNYFKKDFARFVAQRYTFFMLCFAEQGKKKEVFEWAAKAFKTYPSIIFSRRFLVSIYKMLSL